MFGYAATSHNKIEWAQKRQAWDGEVSSQTGDGLHRNLVGAAIEKPGVGLRHRAVAARARRTQQDTQRFERLYFAEVERSKRTTTDGQFSEARAISLNYHAVLRRLDSIVLPTRGYTFSGQAGVGESDGTDARAGTYVRAYGRLTGYLPLGSTWYGQARLEPGRSSCAKAWSCPNRRSGAPAATIRCAATSYRSLGPVVDGAVGGGTALVTASVELARPIAASMPSLWGAVFADAGNAADGFDTLEPVWGAGVGLRWRSPVGPLRLDFAWGDAVHAWRLHFSVGIAF